MWRAQLWRLENLEYHSRVGGTGGLMCGVLLSMIFCLSEDSPGEAAMSLVLWLPSRSSSPTFPLSAWEVYQFAWSIPKSPEIPQLYHCICHPLPEEGPRPRWHSPSPPRSTLIRKGEL